MTKAPGHELLERRLDDIVFRVGFACTIPGARQLVNHGHILVDERRVDIGSYRVAKGQIVSVREQTKALGPVAIGASRRHVEYVAGTTAVARRRFCGSDSARACAGRFHEAHR